MFILTTVITSFSTSIIKYFVRFFNMIVVKNLCALIG